MDEQENPALGQAIARHARMNVTLYSSHFLREAKHAAQERVLQRLLPAGRNAGANAGGRDAASEHEVDRELVYNDELTASKWALNSAVECHLHTVEVIGSNPIAPTINQLTLQTLPRRP